MSQLLKFFLTGATTALVSACAIDAPPPGPTDVWQKSGYTKSQTYSFLLKCGQGQIHSDEDLEKRDLCMMRAGFKYIEWPTHRMCLPRYPRAWNSSACRSLRGELVVTPDESAIEPPPKTEEPTQPRTQTVTVPIAPSTTQAQRLQEQVLRDSNIQMNQLQNPPQLTTTPLPSAASPVAPNPRLDQLKQFKSGR